MYRVSIQNNKYRAVLIGSHRSANTVFEFEDWRDFTARLKRAIEHEAAITLHTGASASHESGISRASELSSHGDRRKD